MEYPDRFCEPMWRSGERRRAILLPWIGWFFAVIGLIAFVSWLASCATTKPPLPPCDRWAADFIIEDDVFYGMYVDAKNVMRLKRLIQGLANGTCRHPAVPVDA